MMPMTAKNQRSIDAQALTGDVAAFGEAIRAYNTDLRRLAWSVLRDPDSVDDVMQLTYEKAFRSLASFDGRSQLKTWLHAICYRTALDHIRYEGRRTHENIEQAELPARAPSVSGTAMSREELRELMGELTPDQRAALLLTHGLGYSFDEVAEITNEKRGTVASRAARARRKIERW